MMRVKICGITRLEDAMLCLKFGAWAIGFVFYPKSPRYLAPQAAAIISNKVGDSVNKIGVFVNESPNTIEKISKEVGLTHVQLHGDETPELCTQLALPVIKAFFSRTQDDAVIVNQYSNLFAALVDAPRTETGDWGGTGRQSNWEFASAIKQFFPLILSGGISVANVREAITQTRPFAVDLSSSVESAPGIKDAPKLTAFFKTISEMGDVQ